MKISYEFVTGESIEIDVPEDIAKISIEIDKGISNSNRRESRRHLSIGKIEEIGIQILDPSVDVLATVIKENTDKELMIAVNQLLPEQQTLIRQIFYDEISITEVARRDGVTEGAVRHRLRKIYSRLKKVLA